MRVRSLRGLPCPNQIAHGFVPLAGYPHRRQVTRPQQPRQPFPIAPVGLHPVARLGWYKRRGHHDARVTQARDQTVQPIARRPGLVAERQLPVLASQPGNQLARGRIRRVDLARVLQAALPDTLGNRHRVTQLRRINPDESFAIVFHDLPSLCEALPGPSG